MPPFKRYTNLHEFIRCLSVEVVTESVWYDEISSRFLVSFLKTYGVSYPKLALKDKDVFWSFAADSDRFHDSIDEITEEVFHVLF